MPDFKEMYFELAVKVATAIDLLTQAQLDGELVDMRGREKGELADMQGRSKGKLAHEENPVEPESEIDE